MYFVTFIIGAYVLPFAPVFGIRRKSVDQSTLSEVMPSVESSRRQEWLEAVDKVCTRGCGGSPVVDAPSLNKSCQLYYECLAFSQNASKLERFPELSADWCDDQLEMLTVQVCGEEVEQLGIPKTPLLLQQFEHVVQILGDEEDRLWSAVVRFTRWADCSKIPTDDHDLSPCEACVSMQHRGGAPRFRVTSHACAWDPVQETCGTEAPGAVTNFADCPANVERRRETSLLETTRRKVGLLIAYEYPYSQSRLPGTVPDIIRMFQHLVQKEGFSPRDITVLTDGYQWQGRDVRSYFRGAKFIQTNQYGSAIEFLQTMQNVVSSLRPGDHFAFHYSGHGYFVPDRDGDELDFYDEALNVPNGETVVDDDFYNLLVRIPQKVTTFIMVDACHSEGFSDLPFNYLSLHRTWCTDWAKPKPLPQTAITYVSGSQNYQTSADLGSGGALSLHALREWAKPKTVYNAMDGICVALSTQDPSLSAWPTFRDEQPWSPFSPDRHLAFDPAVGGSSRSPHARIRAPEVCAHGSRDKQGKAHMRNTMRYYEAQKRFLVDSRLSSAKSILPGDVIPGWSDIVKPTAAPTNAPTSAPTTSTASGHTTIIYSNNDAPGGPSSGSTFDPLLVPRTCACSGKAPRAVKLGDSCTKLLPGNGRTSAAWCYVHHFSGCTDKQASKHPGFYLSEEACTQYQLPPKPLKPISPPSSTVIWHSVPQPRCECNRKLPLDETVGDWCTLWTSAGTRQKRAWCWVDQGKCPDEARVRKVVQDKYGKWQKSLAFRSVKACDGKVHSQNSIASTPGATWTSTLSSAAVKPVTASTPVASWTPTLSSTLSSTAGIPMLASKLDGMWASRKRPNKVVAKISGNIITWQPSLGRSLVATKLIQYGQGTKLFTKMPVGFLNSGMNKHAKLVGNTLHWDAGTFSTHEGDVWVKKR